MDIKVYGVAKESITDGEGVRYTIFTQGCLHDCPGCHNPESHALDGGYTTSIDSLIKEIKASPLIDGVTLSGGDPFFQLKASLELLKRLKKEVKHLNIWVYTGFDYEDILLQPSKAALLDFIDVLVDGRYIEKLRSLELSFKGSSNQRLIDVQKSLVSGQITLIEDKAN